MTQNVESGLLDVLKAIVPAVTFLLGVMVGELNRWRDSRRKVINLKTMLRQELTDSFNKMTPTIPRNDQNFDFPQITAVTASSVNTSIYDGYLSKLDELSASELDVVYAAYQSLNHLKIISEKMSEAIEPGNLDDGKAAAMAAIIVKSAPNSLEKVREALTVLGVPISDMRKHDEQRGKAIDSYKEVIARFQKSRYGN